METITNFISSTHDTKIIKEVAKECEEHLKYLQHMSKPVTEPSIRNIVKQIRKCKNVSEMETLVAQCKATVRNIEHKRKLDKQEQFSQQILEFLQNNVDVGENDVEADKLNALLASFELESATFHMKESNYNEYYDVSFSLNGVPMYFETERGDGVGTIDMTIGEVTFHEFDVFDGEGISDDNMKHFEQYAEDASVTVENYLSFIYKIWDVMTEGECFRDICKYIRYDDEHGRGFTSSSGSSRSSSISC